MAGLSSENKLRDVFNPPVINSFSNNIKKVSADFADKEFLNTILPKLDALGFGERSNLIRDALAEYLPEEFPKAVDILLKALGPELKDAGITDWESFILWPQTAFVSKYGKNHFGISMNALYEMTKRFSAECDLRTFIEVDYERAMEILHTWCDDPSPHVRRLVSEGTRPRLPLAGRIKRFQNDPRPVIALLDKLKDDEVEYVRRSVANNINDIAKDNPEIAVITLKKWCTDKNPAVQWVVRHAARSLVKQGHPEVIGMLGYAQNPGISVSGLAINPNQQERGGKIEMSFSIHSNENFDQQLVIDFVLYFNKANNKLSPKVFKLRDLLLKAQKTADIKKIFTLKNTAGRTIYTGRHFIEIQINGKAYGKEPFDVV